MVYDMLRHSYISNCAFEWLIETMCSDVSTLKAVYNIFERNAGYSQWWVVLVLYLKPFEHTGSTPLV